jgi:uncharacterized membrane protein YfcA
VIAAVVLGLLIGVTLGALGGGGSILAVPVLAHVAGQSAGAATATSLVAVGAAAVVGAYGHARVGNVRWRAAAAFVATGVAGSWAGAELNGRLDGDVLLLAFSGLVLVAAHRMLTACPSCTNVGEERAIEAAGGAPGPGTSAPVTSRGAVASGGPGSVPPGAPGSGIGVLVPPAPPRSAGRSVGKVLVAGTVVGFLTGLFGVGGGFVIVPALTLALGLSMPAAIGTSLVVIVGNAVVALGFRGFDAVDWDLAVPFTVTMLIGSLVGSLVANRLPPTASLRAFAALLVIVAVGNGVAAGLSLTG